MSTTTSPTQASEHAVRRSDLLGIDEVWRAMNVAERLAVIRSARPALPLATAEVEAIGKRLDAWRDLRSLDSSELPDPTQVHDCREEELAAVLVSAPPAGSLLHDVADWSLELNERWRRGRQLVADVDEWSEVRSLLAYTPFASVALPWIAVSTAGLRAQAESLRSTTTIPFSPASIEALLLPMLAERLERLTRRTCVLEMHAARRMGLLDGATPQERFTSFARQMAQPSTAEEILRHSPVLARIAFTAVANWETFTRELLRHIAQDWSELCEHFGMSSDDEIASVQSVGDLHRGGRSVLAVSFAQGRPLIYKPRSVHSEKQYQRLVEWLSALPGFPRLRHLQMIVKPDHGWVEFVSPTQCPPDERSTLHHRYGAALAVLRAVAATDCHFQNVISAGADPVVIDHEALFHSFLKTEVEALGPAEQAVMDATDGSVLTVGLLPSRRWWSKSEGSVDISGLGAREDEWSPATRLRWVDEYTDLMREVLEDANASLRAITRRVPDERPNPLDYVDDLASGFASACHLLRKHAGELLAAEGPLEAFADLETRCILRATGQYGYILETASHPAFTADGVEMDKRFDQLIAAGRHFDTLQCQAERAQLWQLDVPIFHATPSTRDVTSPLGHVLVDHLAESGLERARHRVLALSESDLERQLWLIRLSIAVWAINRGEANEADEKTPLSIRPFAGESARDFAVRLSERLSEIAIRRGGEATWLGPQYRASDDSWVVDLVSPSLFDGLAGISLALAYVADAAGDSRSRLLAAEALRTLERHTDWWIDHPASDLTIGVSGVGGWIYALTHLGCLWKDERLLSRCDRLIPLLRSCIEGAPTVDVIGGAAGAVRPLLALHDLTGSPDALEAAIACGDEIVASALAQVRGVGWLSPAGPAPLGGFAHGVAGIVWALLHLYAKTGTEVYKETAEAGLDYERSLWLPTEGNWRDLRQPPRSSDLAFMPSGFFWCHGSVGIGLARLDTLDGLSGAAIDDEIQAALDATADFGFRPDHSLCHGFGGSAELFLSARARGYAPHRSDGEDVASIDEWGEAMLAHMDRVGCTSGCALGIEVPGLFMGLSGIAYELLRLSEPERFPSVLLLEPPRQRR